MFGSPTTRRQRRPLGAWLAVLMLVGLVECLIMSGRARSAAIAGAATGARLAARAELATLLEPRDLIAPDMSKPSDAPDEIQQEAPHDETNDPLEHLVIIRGNGGSGAKVR